MSKTLRLLLGDQLNSKHSWFKTTDTNITYVLMEVMQEQRYVMHHVQKILAFFAAMRNFAHQLTKNGHHVIYINLNDKDNKQDFGQNLHWLIDKYHITRFEYQQPDEYRLDSQLKKICAKLTAATAVANTEHFLNDRYAVKNFFGDKNYLMETFYRDTRKRMGILMNGDKPAGGKWNFDAENRKKYDGKVPLVEPLLFTHDVSVIKEMIGEEKVKYFGEVDTAKFEWPLTRAEALKLLHYFCEHLLAHFGTYEDALLSDHYSLYHSRLSFALNIKMISPAEVVTQVLRHYQDHQDTISLAQVEGYIRQIIGWREFMRGVYWAKMPAYEELNFFGYDTPLPSWYWNGKTKMNCMGKCISQSLQKAWAHHIQRLMVIGNFSLLAGLNPDDVDAWYLGVYIDAIQWVEITNTRGMSQFADGGIIASKPYVSSAAYINKMSDYCKGCTYDPQKKYGENACPFNSLYWNFFDRNADKLANNPRIGMMYNVWNKFTREEQQRINTQAAFYLAHLEDL
jgi:deoxyribodipyrimidine photolyase-related protein